MSELVFFICRCVSSSRVWKNFATSSKIGTITVTMSASFQWRMNIVTMYALITIVPHVTSSRPHAITRLKLLQSLVSRDISQPTARLS